MKELKFKPTEVQKLIYKDDEGCSNYIPVSIEEMDYMIDLAIKYQQLHESWQKGIEEKEEAIFFFRKCKEVIEDFKPDCRNSRA